MNNTIVKETLSYIREHLEEDISIEDIVKNIYCSRSTLQHTFKKETGTNVTQEINNQRIVRSIPQLETTNDSILKVAMNHGFHSQEYYCEIFKNRLSVTPSDYRNLVRKDSLTKQELGQLYQVRNRINELHQNHRTYLEPQGPTLIKTLH